jgi:hypothetical protein
MKIVKNILVTISKTPCEFSCMQKSINSAAAAAAAAAAACY